MNYEEFTEEVLKRLQNLFQERGINTELKKVTAKKNNCELLSIAVKLSEPMIAGDKHVGSYASLYLINEEDYLNTIWDDEKISVYTQHLLRCYVDGVNGQKSINVDEIIRPENLRIAVVAKNEVNAQMLDGIVKREYLDMYAFCEVALISSKDETRSIKVNAFCLQTLGMTENEAFERAVKNTKETGFVIKPIEEVIKAISRELDGQEIELWPMDGCIQMHVITNRYSMKGASAIYFPEVFKDLSDKLENDLHILPSSVHDCIAVTADTLDAGELQQMVQEINETQVQRDEVLTNNVYRYVRETNEIIQVTFK